MTNQNVDWEALSMANLRDKMALEKEVAALKLQLRGYKAAAWGVRQEAIVEAATRLVELWGEMDRRGHNVPHPDYWGQSVDDCRKALIKAVGSPSEPGTPK